MSLKNLQEKIKSVIVKDDDIMKTVYAVNDFLVELGLKKPDYLNHISASRLYATKGKFDKVVFLPIDSIWFKEEKSKVLPYLTQTFFKIHNLGKSKIPNAYVFDHKERRKFLESPFPKWRYYNQNHLILTKDLFGERLMSAHLDQDGLEQDGFRWEQLFLNLILGYSYVPLLKDSIIKIDPANKERVGFIYQHKFFPEKELKLYGKTISNQVIKLEYRLITPFVSKNPPDIGCSDSPKELLEKVFQELNYKKINLSEYYKKIKLNNK